MYSIPHSIDTESVHGLVAANQLRTGRAGRGHDHAVHRIPDPRERSELDSLRNVEGEYRVPTVPGHRFQNLGRTDPKATPLVEKPRLDDCDRRHVAKRPTSVAGREDAPGGLPQPPRIGQVPDERVRVSDECTHGRSSRQRQSERSKRAPLGNRQGSEPGHPGRCPKAHAAPLRGLSRAARLFHRSPARSIARLVGTATGPHDAPGPRRVCAGLKPAGWSGWRPSCIRMYSDRIGLSSAVQPTQRHWPGYRRGYSAMKRVMAKRASDSIHCW
jgi:hypothetical protein